MTPFIFIAVGVVIGVFGTRIYFANRLRASKDIAVRVATANSDLRAEKYSIIKKYDEAIAAIKKSYAIAIEDVLTKPEAEIKAEVEKLLATAKKIL